MIMKMKTSSSENNDYHSSSFNRQLYSDTLSFSNMPDPGVGNSACTGFLKKKYCLYNSS